MREFNAVRIKEKVLNSVVFLGYLKDPNDATSEEYRGSGFIAGVEEDDVTFLYLVTAAHVALHLEKLGEYGRPIARVNDMHGEGRVIQLRNPEETELVLPSGESRTFTTPAWLYHPTDENADVAVQELYVKHDYGPLRRPLPGVAYMSSVSFVPVSMLLHPEKIGESRPIGIGDEVFLTGLFHFARGGRGNVPIARVGNLAMVPDERIYSGAYYQEIDRTYGDMDAYLIEARSIAGLSGSPVYIRGTVDVPNTEHDSMKATDAEYYLLGIVHGHWDIREKDLDATVLRTTPKGVNVGIAIVTPAQKILEVLNHERFKRQRAAFLQMRRESGAAKKRQP